MANENMIQTHVDNFLAKIVGETPIDDKPRNSTEFWLNEIAENGGGGTTVIANPTLAGTEDALTGLQVGETKYAMPKYYIHNIAGHINGFSSDIKLSIITNDSTPFTLNTFITYMTDKGITNTTKGFGVSAKPYVDNGNNVRLPTLIHAQGAYAIVMAYGVNFAIVDNAISITVAQVGQDVLSSLTDTVISI